MSMFKSYQRSKTPQLGHEKSADFWARASALFHYAAARILLDFLKIQKSSAQECAQMFKSDSNSLISLVKIKERRSSDLNREGY